MVHSFQSLTDNHSPAEETVYSAFLTSFICEALYLVTKLQMVHDELSGITSVQRTLSVDGSIKSERQQKKKNSDGCWIEPMLLITHSTPQNLTSNELSGDEKENNPAKTSWEMVLSPFTSLAEPSGWWTWHHPAKRRSEGRRETGAKGIQGGQEMLRAIYLSSEMLEMERRWLYGAVRKRGRQTNRPLSAHSWHIA